MRLVTGAGDSQRTTGTFEEPFQILVNKYMAQFHIIEGIDTAKISVELKSKLIKISVELVKNTLKPK